MDRNLRPRRAPDLEIDLTTDGVAVIREHCRQPRGA